MMERKGSCSFFLGYLGVTEQKRLIDNTLKAIFSETHEEKVVKLVFQISSTCTNGLTVTEQKVLENILYMGLIFWLLCHFCLCLYDNMGMYVYRCTYT